MPTISPEQIYTWTDEQRRRAMDWAWANGINPNDVRAGGGIEIGEGAILYQRFVRNERGRLQLRPGSADEAWTEPEIARYLVELPDGL